MPQNKTAQLDLFSEVLHAYSAENHHILDNASLYAHVVKRTGLPMSALSERSPVGHAQQPRNLLTRRIRWYQQTLKHAGILERVDGERGVWRLTSPASKDLNQIDPTVSVVGFSTELGIAILGSCETVFSKIDSPIHLVVTSPPYPLSQSRNYGNPKESDYVDWICKTIEPLVRNLARGASVCLNVGNDVFMPGSPARSLYREKLILALHERLGLYKMDEFIWHNPSKPPGPVKWASITRQQLNVSWEPVYWLTNDPHAVRSDNRRVLQAHSERHLNFIKNGGVKAAASKSDGAYRIRPGSYSNETPGKIPRNVLARPVLHLGHSCSDQREYRRLASAEGLPPHGATMPLSLASFLIEFLSQPDDLVVDPFGGSFTTAKAAERLGRRWLSTECMVEYVIGAASRFREFQGFQQMLAA